MSMIRIVATMASLTFLATAPVLAQSPSIDVRTGLWEMTSERTTSGMPQMPKMPAIPPEVLAKMTPAQRAQIQAAMGARSKPKSGRRVKKVCVTAETLRKGDALGMDRDPSCKRTKDTRSARLWQLQETCVSRGRKRTLDVRYEAANRETIDGTVDVAMTDGTHNIRMKQVMHGRWLGADCGNVKPKKADSPR